MSEQILSYVSPPLPRGVQSLRQCARIRHVCVDNNDNIDRIRVGTVGRGNGRIYEMTRGTDTHSSRCGRNAAVSPCVVLISCFGRDVQSVIQTCRAARHAPKLCRYLCTPGDGPLPLSRPYKILYITSCKHGALATPVLCSIERTLS